ncbi:MAG: exopolysaccharide biosynthesis polyprenyl glycosylphosphotransferase [Lachnospiraceae bacterium]|nr:exopolysaccharide biosynthesis polyprenyl glycosylphosphotransferase [Lachnospiraceae bacterium]
MKKLESFKRVIQLFLAGIGLALQVWLFSHFYYMYYAPEIMRQLPFWNKGHLAIIFIYAVLLYMFSTMYGAMKVGRLKAAEVAISSVISTIFTAAIMYIQICLMSFQIMYPWNYLRMVVEQMVVGAVWIVFASWLYPHIFPARKLLLVHGDRPIDEIVAKFESRKDKYIISKTMNVRESVEKICAEAEERYDGVVIWDIPSIERNKILKFCYGKSIRVYIMPKISDVILSGAEQLHIFDTPILLNREYSLRIEQRFMKRLIDIICSLILIILTSPFMIITAIAVKFYDGGHILYKQVRCTEDAREFKILKFRSMREDAEKDGVARLARENDNRITPVGKFIRKCRLDELPQLFNILKGDMSFIGPRPERPEIIKQYLESMPEFAFRMKVKAGLAGYAQVYGKYNTTPYDKLKLDLTYIENYSVWLDIKLMFLTIRVLFTPDATEGVGEEQVTALKDSAAQEKE